jgi:hypothetical protein
MTARHPTAPGLSLGVVQAGEKRDNGRETAGIWRMCDERKTFWSGSLRWLSVFLERDKVVPLTG